MRWMVFILLLLVVACTRRTIKTPQEAMRALETIPDFSDDMDLGRLRDALVANVQVLRTKGDVPLTFGPRKVTSREYARALGELISALERDAAGNRFRALLREGFEVMEVYGQERWGEVFLTSYFEPVIEGSLRSRPPFTEPLYGAPRDYVEVDLNSFAGSRPGLSGAVLRGRLMPPTSAVPAARVVAFPDRAGIGRGELKGDASPLAWVDPIDAFFLEIQGSGVVKLREGGELRLGYAAQNGFPYVAIGRFLLDRIPKEHMSQQAIETHLRHIPPDQVRDLLNRNPSYVFFRRLKGHGVSNLGVEVVPGRTIATDAAFFPKGALAYLQFDRPRFSSVDAVEPLDLKPTARFVLDQDTGGAIKGPGRVDLFWGRGSEAKQAAGVMRGAARLLYFVPRADWLTRLK